MAEPPRPLPASNGFAKPAVKSFLLIPARLIRKGRDNDLDLQLSAAEKRIQRLKAIETQIHALGDASISWLTGATAARNTMLVGQAPFAIVKQKSNDRFRLPRALKSELIDRFCSAEAAELATLKTMIVVAHPDDESIGAGSRLCHLPTAWVVDVTDGAPRDLTCAQRHGYQTREAYAEARRRELRDALAVAGLPEDRLISLGFVDGEASLRLAELCLKVTELIEEFRPDVVLTHAYEGGHTDHDATAFAVHLACGVLWRERVRPPAVLELTSYHARNGKKVVQQFLPHARADRDQRFVELTEVERELKQKLFDCFGSQRKVLGEFNSEFERFRPAPRYVFTLPPHAGQLNYERYGNPERGKVWRAQAEQALRKLQMRRD